MQQPNSHRLSNFSLCGCVSDWPGGGERKLRKRLLCAEHARQARQRPVCRRCRSELSAAPHSPRTCMCHTRSEKECGAEPAGPRGDPSLNWHRNLTYIPPAIMLLALSIACRSAADAGTGPRRAPLEEIRRNIQAAGLEPVERDGRFDRRVR